MATTKAPLLSLAASGSIGKAIVFSIWKGRSYVRKSVKPANPKSGLQVGMRAMMSFISRAYAPLTAGQKANWKVLSKAKNITAANSMTKQAQTRNRQNHGPKKDPTFPFGPVGAAPTAPVATPFPKSIEVTWVDSAGANDWLTMVYMSTLNGFVP